MDKTKQDERALDLAKEAIQMGVPDSVINGLINYAIHGIPTGGFLQAVLENNLMEAFGRADLDNREALWNICSFIYNHLPKDCHGSPSKYAAWLNMMAERLQRAEATK